MVMDSALLWARTPRLFAPVALLYGMLGRKSSSFGPALRPLVTVGVRPINGHPFCMCFNSATRLRRKFPPAKMEALETWRQNNLFEDGACGARTSRRCGTTVECPAQGHAAILGRLGVF